jgi:hypothetical protein
MRALALHIITICLLLGAATEPATAQDAQRAPASAGRTAVMVLGTFHFQDAGLDEYKPRFAVDVLSEARQREVADLLDRLERFRPTIIAVEWREERQAALDSAYAAFRSRERPASANETQQLGFRLAERLGHTQVRAIDAAARWYDLAMNSDTLAARAQRFDQTQLLQRAPEWDRWYQRQSQLEDSIKTTMTLREYLLQLNTDASMRRLMSQYLTGTVEVGGRGDYSGADMRSAWYNRNLRIFTNLLRMQTEREERILVIVGAGHAPLLRHFIGNAPELRLVLPEDYLR